MNIKKIIYGILAFAIPWILIVVGVIMKIHNAWLYVGCMTWFLSTLFISFSLYKF